MPKPSLFAELQKRKVVQSALIYCAVAWAVTEGIVTIVEQLFLPQWVSTLAVIFFVVGFPVAMFLAWTFDITSEGIHRATITSRRGTASIVFSIALLIAGTAGLFYLIKPALDSAPRTSTSISFTPNSVAILPFDFTGPNPDDNYLGPGLSDELRDQLSRVQGLRKLIDGSSGLAVWQRKFDRGHREVLNVQQDIAQAVAYQLLPDSAPEIAAPITQDATAHDKMILARHYEQQIRERETVDPDLMERTVQLYREAAELDPGSALAQSRLAGALLLFGDVDGAQVAAFKALAIEPNLAEVQHTLGKLLFTLGRPNMGDPLARAVQLNPNLPDALHDYAHWRWFNVGEQGIEELYRSALELDPLNVGRYGALGLFLAVTDDYVGAREVVEQLKELFDSPESFRAIAKIYDHIGDVDHAIAWTIKARNAEPENTEHVEKLAEYYIDIGDFETAEALTPELGVGLLFKMRRYDEMIDKAEMLIFDYPEDEKLRIVLGEAYGMTGQYDRAVRMIRSTGVLDTLANGNRGIDDWNAYKTLIDAGYGSGEFEETRALIAWARKSMFHAENAYWWVSVGNACEAAIMGEDTEVHRRLKQALEGNQPAWQPALKDVACFRRFQDDPAYLAVVEHFDERRRILRERLPTTLAQYGVSLN